MADVRPVDVRPIRTERLELVSHDRAATEHGLLRFRASIAPDNVASLTLVARLGFTVVGRRFDEVDGEELVLERDDWVVEPAT